MGYSDVEVGEGKDWIQLMQRCGDQPPEHHARPLVQTLCKICSVYDLRARCTWDRAQANARKPATDPSHVTSTVHRSSLWSSHMYVSKYTRGATPATPMPKVSVQTGPRTYQSLVCKHTHATLLETPRQPRPCQRLDTDGPALVHEPRHAYFCFLLICAGIDSVVRVCVVFVFLSPQSGQDTLFHRFPHLATSQLR